MNVERWAKIDDPDIDAEISTLGRVRKNGNIIKATNSAKYGVITVNMLNRFGKQHRLRVHREVAKAFLPNPRNYAYVTHIDKDKSNNNVNNLRWTADPHWYDRPQPAQDVDVGETSSRYDELHPGVRSLRLPTIPHELVNRPVRQYITDDTRIAYPTIMDGAESSGTPMMDIYEAIESGGGTAGGNIWTPI